MPADLAGAFDAIRAKFVAEWISAPETPRTRIAFVNETPEQPWPPRAENNTLESWVLFEIAGAGQSHGGFGTPGAQTYTYDGIINIHVFTPAAAGVAIALALAAGEIFKNKTFYGDVSPGCYVRTGVPSVDGGGEGDERGAYHRISATIPFEYWHRG